MEKTKLTREEKQELLRLHKVDDKRNDCGVKDQSNTYRIKDRIFYRGFDVPNNSEAIKEIQKCKEQGLKCFKQYCSELEGHDKKVLEAMIGIVEGLSHLEVTSKEEIESLCDGDKRLYKLQAQLTQTIEIKKKFLEMINKIESITSIKCKKCNGTGYFKQPNKDGGYGVTCKDYPKCSFGKIDVRDDFEFKWNELKKQQVEKL